MMRFVLLFKSRGLSHKHGNALINESPRNIFRCMGGESCDRHLIYPCHVIFIDLKVEYFGVFDYALFMY